MRVYTVYHKDFVPEAYPPHHPGAPYIAGEYVLLTVSLEDLTGTPAEMLVDLSGYGLQENDGEQEGVWTKAELLEQVTALMESEPIGKETRLSIPQGKFLAEHFEEEPR